MKNFLIYLHNKLVDCLGKITEKSQAHENYTARIYSLKSGGACFVLDPPTGKNADLNSNATLNNYIDINKFLVDTSNSPALSVNERPVIWARFMEIGDMEWIVVINSDHELYASPLRNSVDFAPVTNPIIIAFVLKTLLKINNR